MTTLDLKNSLISSRTRVQSLNLRQSANLEHVLGW